jgi:PBP1b-binding outer membrane lipoprotein LpoB
MTKMKKVSLVLFGLMVLVGCTKHDVPVPQVISDNLKISSVVGLKLETPFITSEVAMNIKSDVNQTVTVKILDISNRVVSKSTNNVKTGDNILRVYTSALPSSAYRIALYDNAGNLLAITDFNKI